MKYIASCSFGKDSLAAIITRKEHGEPVDEAVYCRIMFDDETSAEYPEHEDWIHGHAIPLLKSQYGINTTIVQGPYTYVDCFYTKYESGEKAGKIWAFPFLNGPWCNSRLKVRPMNAWGKSIGEYSQIVGIAFDEKKRAERDTVKGKILPLVEHEIPEIQTFDICRKADLLSPAYSNDRDRLGCWFCHNQRIGSLRRLRHEYPQLWKKLMVLDRDSHVKFKPDRTLADFEERFWNEDAQLTLWNYKEASSGCICDTPCGRC